MAHLVQRCADMAAGDLPGVVSVEFGAAIWLPCSWVGWSCNSSFFISRFWVSFWSWRVVSEGNGLAAGFRPGRGGCVSITACPVESFGDAVEGVSLVVRLFWDYIRLGRREFSVSVIFPSDDCPWGLSKCVWKRCVLVYRRQCFPLTIRAKMTLSVACRTRSSTHGE